MSSPIGEADGLETLWQRARQAAEAGDLAGALYVLRALADRGAWEAYAKLGWLYERGAKGIEKDLEKALFWYRRAVFEADDPTAHVGLGRAYLSGLAVAKDFNAARDHFQKATLKDNPEGALYLGMIYYLGLGVERDIEKARVQLEKAAASDYCYAIIPLALIEARRGRLLKALRIYLHGRRRALEMARNDPNDDRLIGFSIPGR